MLEKEKEDQYKEIIEKADKFFDLYMPNHAEPNYSALLNCWNNNLHCNDRKFVIVNELIKRTKNNFNQNELFCFLDRINFMKMFREQNERAVPLYQSANLLRSILASAKVNLPFLEYILLNDFIPTSVDFSMLMNYIESLEGAKYYQLMEHLPNISMTKKLALTASVWILLHNTRGKDKSLSNMIVSYINEQAGKCDNPGSGSKIFENPPTNEEVTKINIFFSVKPPSLVMNREYLSNFTIEECAWHAKHIIEKDTDALWHYVNNALAPAAFLEILIKNLLKKTSFEEALIKFKGSKVEPEALAIMTQLL